MKGTAESVGADTHVHDRAAVEAVILVESEFPPVVDAVDPVSVLRLRIRKFIYDFLNIWNGAFKALEHLAERSLDIRNLALAFEALALEDDLAAVGVCICDGPPDADSVRMLLRRIDLDLYRIVVVLAEDVLYRIDVVLTHITESAAVIVPVAAEGIMGTMPVVWLVRSRAEPHVIVEFGRNRLRNEILLSCPEELPCEAGGARNAHCKRQ